MKHLHSAFLALAAALLLTVAAAPHAHAQTAGRDNITIELNKGQMVRLSRVASSVMVANPEIADIQVVSPRMVYVHARAVGQTSLYALDGQDVPIMDALINVTHSIKDLESVIRETLPSADVKVRTTAGGLVLHGFVDSPQDADNVQSIASTFIGNGQRVVNMLTTAGSDQVTLMVRVAEVSRSELKRFGINLASALSSGNFAFQLLQGRNIFDAAGNIARSGRDTSLYTGYQNGSRTVDGLIDALETQGLISVLAEPNLTTTSGKPANFLAGGEFPIPIVDGDGRVNVQFRPYGISLAFTPVVMSRDKISLTVRPEVSSISSLNELTLGSTSSFSIPSIQTRRAETTVELGSGQTFAIAGLLKNDRANNIQKFPGLGDVPVLGALFRSQEFQNDQSELVILVTPYVVKPVNEHAKMQTPLDGYTPPNDVEELLLGKLYQPREKGEGDRTPPADSEPVAIRPDLRSEVEIAPDSLAPAAGGEAPETPAQQPETPARSDVTALPPSREILTAEVAAEAPPLHGSVGFLLE